MHAIVSPALTIPKYQQHQRVALLSLDQYQTMVTSNVLLPSTYTTEQTHKQHRTTINPSVNDINTIPLSQPQTNTTPINISNSFVPLSLVPTTSNLAQSHTGTTYHRLPPKNKFERVFHEQDVNYIMTEYCLPISESFTCDQDICNFKRDCIVSKKKILTKGSLLTSLSPTVYRCVPSVSKTNTYSILDVRILKCFNPSCKHPTTKKAKVFHHACFMHMLNTNETDDMPKIHIESSSDKIVELVDTKYDVSFLNILSNDDFTHLLFPFCGKRCFNTIINYRNKAVNKSGDSEYATTHSWDKDGSSKKRTSIVVLIDWFTIQENCSNYFGGVDEKGRTNANRKDTYHYMIRDLIRNENGKYLIFYNSIIYNIY